jgi:hypothetical protein
MMFRDTSARPLSAAVKSGMALAFCLSNGLAASVANGAGTLPQGNAPAHATLEARVSPAAGGNAISLPNTGRMLQRFAPTYMSKKTSAYSNSDAVLIAQNYDLIVGNSIQFNSTNIPAMKSANPTARILVYLNGSFDMFGNPNINPTYSITGCAGAASSGCEYAKDINGNYIESTKYHNWLMNIGAPDWAASVSLHCTQLLATAPYDGCFVDMLGDALLTGSYLSGQPINPATGLVWTTAQRMAATTLIGAKVTSDHADNIIMGNGLNDGQRYFDPTAPTSQLLSGVNTGLAETWLRQATMPIGKYRSPSVWQQEVNLLADVGGRGKFSAETTKVWITATAAQILSWHRYALASFLLGTTGSSYFSFTQSQSSTEFQTDATSALDHTPTGAAVAPFKAQGAAFTREYVDAEVIVNPTKNVVTLSVPETCTTLDGVTVQATKLLTMPAESGQICSYSSGGTVPAVTSIAPAGGPPTGGTTVQITGTGFTPASAVAFGGAAATRVTYTSSSKITATSPAGVGKVDVTVTTVAGSSAATSADQFTYAPPVVTGVSPLFGPATGGTSVTIIGTGFTGATAVDFGSIAASNVTVVSDTQITATSPAGAAGPVDVTVANPSVTSAMNPSNDTFTYEPAVTGLSPANGPAAGGTLVTITGEGFTGATAVDFGSNPASGVTVTSDTQITASSPTGAGLVDVRVTTPVGTSATTSSDQFTYAPVVNSATPNSGSAAGGASVTITGSGFTGATAVSFGSNSATSFTFVSDTEITLNSPPGSVGQVDVTVTTPAGTSAIAPSPDADDFTYSP